MPATSALGDKARWWVLGAHWSPGLAEMVIYILVRKSVSKRGRKLEEDS